MNTIFETITDVTLRRVYKLVLKRSIGKYLEDELLIDQLEVQSREGKFAVHNLRLSADLLNAELFSKTPLKVMALEIEELNVAISYSSLVSDGLQVNVTAIDIHFCPNKNIASVDGEDDQNDKDDHEETVPALQKIDTATSDEGREGLSFIGTWIEVIVAKLRAKIDRINVYLHPIENINNNDPSMVIRLSNISFFNADPSGEAQGSSMQLSRSVMSSLHQSATLTALSSTKVVEIESISISINESQNKMEDCDILKMSGKVVTKIRLKSEKDVDLDLSVTIPILHINLEKNLISKISCVSMKFISTIEKNVSETKLQEALASAIERRPKIAAKYLLEIEKDILAKEKSLKAGDNASEMFVSSLLSQMRSLHQSSQRVPFSANQLQASSLINENDHQSIDSDGDFPSSDEEEFFDTQEFGTKSHFHSALGSSYLGRSKLSYLLPPSSSTLSKQSLVKFNVFIVNASMDIVDCEHPERKLILSLTESVITIESRSKSERNLSDILDVSVQFTTNTLDLVDQTLDIELPPQVPQKKTLSIVSFSKHHDASTIYGTPDLSLTVRYIHDKLAPSTNSQASSSTPSAVPIINVDVTFGSIVAAGSAQQIAHWGKVGSSLFTIEVASEPTTTMMNFHMKVPSIELYFRSDDRIADTVWEDINTALMLDVCRDNWTKINFHKRPYLRKHLAGAKGGLHFVVKGLRIEMTSVSGHQPSLSQNIEMDRITLSIFVNATGIGNNQEVLFLKSTIISAFADENPSGEKIYVKKCSDRSFGRQTGSNKNIAEGDDMGPSPPLVDMGRIVFIRTHKLSFEVEQREFHALMMIGDTLILSSKETVIVEDSLTFDMADVSEKEDDPSFGLQISTSFATLTFSENSRNFWDTFDVNVIPNSVCGGAMRNLVKILREVSICSNSNEGKFHDSKLKLCVSIRDPKLELYSVEGQIFVSMTADDLSVYELTPTTYKDLLTEGFNFHRSKDWNGVRVGAQRHRIPFIRRAFVPVDDGKGKGATSVGNSVLLSDHSRYGHAFEVRLCMSHENQQFRDFAAIKSVHFFIDFYDILINHDPTSTWFFQLINIMTPQSAEQMIQNNLDDIVTQLQKYEHNWTEHHRKMIDDVLNTLSVSSSTHSLLVSHVSDTGGRKVIITPFEVTKISVRVRDSMMDYSHVEMNSRIILSVGLIAISSTIASNSDRVTLKLSLSALTFYACNDIVTDKDSVSKEISTDRMETSDVNGISTNQSLLRQWMHQNNFVNLLDIDYLTNLVTLNETEQDELSLRFTLGNCTISGCVDSLVIFKNALGQWFKEFEYSCGQSETILRKKKKKHYDSRGVELDAVKLGEGCTGDLDRVRYCDEISEVGNKEKYYEDDVNGKETVRIPDELLQSRFPMAPAYNLKSNVNLHQNRSLNGSFMRQSGFGGGAVSLNILEKYYDHRMEDDLPEYVDETMNNMLQRSRFVEDWAVQDVDPRFEDLLEHDPDALPTKLTARPQQSFEADYGYGNYDNDTASEVPSISTAFAPDIKAKMRLEKLQQRSVKTAFDAEEVSSETGEQSMDENDHLHTHDDNTVDSSVLSAYGGGMLMNLQPLKQNLTINNSNNANNNNNLTISRMFFGDVRHRTPEPVELRSFDRHNMEMAQSYDEHDNVSNEINNMLGESKISALGTSDMLTSENANQMNNIASFDLYDFHYDTVRGKAYENDRMDIINNGYFEKIRNNPDNVSSYSSTNVPGPVSISQRTKISPLSNKGKTFATGVSHPVTAVTQPGLGKAVLQEMHEVDVAWEKIDRTISQDQHPNNADHCQYNVSNKHHLETERLKDTSLPFSVEQETRWYMPQSQIDIQTHYIPVFASGSGNDLIDGVVEDHRPASERQLATKVFVQLNGNFKLRLHEGTQWQQTPIDEETKGTLPSDDLTMSDATNDIANQRKDKTNKSVSFATSENIADINSNKPLVKKPALFPHSNKKKTLIHSTIASDNKSDQSEKFVNSQSRLVPLDERYSLDVFLKRISVQVSIYDHPAASSLTFANLKCAESSDGWRDFDVDGHTVHSVPLINNAIINNNNNNNNPEDTILPHERITVSVQDFLITFGHSDTRHITSNNQRRKKVLGYWQSSQHPRDQAKPMVHLSVLGYRDVSRVVPQLLSIDVSQRENTAKEEVLSGSSEYRVHGVALPLRLFLSDEVVQFVRQIVDENVPQKTAISLAHNHGEKKDDKNIDNNAISKPNESTDAYFQQVTLAALALKIDYRASAVNLRALQQGDYLQLLNIFPIDGLEISLAAQKLHGVDGSAQLTDMLLRHWVQDIYANQLHRVLSGAAPLKSLSNIGKDLQGLLYIPAAQLPRSKPAISSSTSSTQKQQPLQYKNRASVSNNNQAVLRHLQKGTKTLLSTVARETLDVSHKLTMFVAQTITDLAAPETLSNNTNNKINNNINNTNTNNNNNNSGGKDTSSFPSPSSNAVSVVNNDANVAARHMMQTNLIHQPRGLSEGLTRAYEAVSRELSVAAETVIAVPVRQYESLGPSGLISSVIRALPIAVLRPVAGVAEGLSYTILGLRNALDPETQRDEEDLWNVDLPLN